MDWAEGETYYLKELELKLLLAALGQTQWYGLFSDEDASEVKQETIHAVLAELYQKGVIDWEDERIAVNRPYSRMLFAMLERKKCVTIQGPEEETGLCCCYLSAAEVIQTGLGQREEQMLRLRSMRYREWYALLEGEIDRMEDGQELKLVCKNSESGQECMQFLVQQKGIRAEMVLREGKREKHVPYRHCLLIEWIGDFVKGGAMQ